MNAKKTTLCNYKTEYGTVIKGYDPDSFSDDYMNRLLSLIKVSKYKEISILSNGVAISDNLNHLGCYLCLDKEPEQNDLGYPTISNKELISGYDIDINLNSVIKSNFWLCPNCTKPISQLIPNYL